MTGKPAEKLTLETAIAHRSFELAGNPDNKVDIFIGKPYPVEDDEWHCPYRVVGGGEDLNFKIIGIDSVQALQLVFKVIDGVVAGADLDLWWCGEKFVGFVPD